MTTSRDTGDLIERASRLLRDYMASGRTRTDLLKQVAETVVDLRAAHSLDDGRTDWAGRSPRYRAAIHEVYSKAGVPADKLDTVQQAIRYHAGNLLRERVPKMDLEHVGLTPIAPKQRLARNREVVAALAASGSVAEITRDPVRLIAHAIAILEYVSEDDLHDLRAKEKAVARKACVHLCDRAEVLKAATVTRRGSGAAASQAV